MTQPVVLTPLLSSNIPEIVSAANEAIILLDQLKDNKITKSEFDELIDDLTLMDNINRDMITLEVYIDIQRAFVFIMTLKSITTLI